MTSLHLSTLAHGPGEEPYIGPRPFQREDEAKLFGRDDETSELLSLIGACSIVVLHAQSGAGKTSLLHAKIIPNLERRPCEVIGPLRVRGDVPRATLKSVKNVFVYNALMGKSLIAKGVSSRRVPTLANFLKSKPAPESESALRMPRVVVFDQFEELFSLYPQRWQDRRDFFDDIAEAIDADPRLHVVFAMREEYLGSFDAYSSDIAARLKTRFRLERLRKAQALEAIRGPLEGTPVKFKPGADEALVTALLTLRGETFRSDEFAEPLQLQLVCQKIWRNLGGVREIDEKMVQTAGDVEQALYAYYDRVVGLAATETVSEGTLRIWFERHLITDDGNRSIVHRGALATAGLPNAVVDAIEREYLIRSEPRGEATWYELSHDRFIPPILKSNREWRQKKDRDSRAHQLESRASDWKKTLALEREEASSLLLTGAELRRTREWLETDEARDIGISDAARELVARSQAAQQETATRRLRLQLLLGVAAVFVCIGMIIVVMRAKYAAEVGKAAAQMEIANTLTDEGKPIEALPWALNASSGIPSKESTEVLRHALTILGGADWVQRPKSPFTAIDLARSGDRFLTRSATEICTWRLTDVKQPVCRPAASGFSWRYGALSPAGTWVLAVGIRDDESQGPTALPTKSKRSIWRADSGQDDEFMEAKLAKFFALSATDSLVATISTAGGSKVLLSLFDTATKLERCHGFLERSPHSLFVSPKGKTLGTTAADETTLWDSSCRKLRSFRMGETFAVVADADGADNVIALGSPVGSEVRVFGSGTGAEIGQPFATEAALLEPFFSVSPDGKQIAMLNGRKLERYEIATRHPLPVPPTLEKGSLYGSVYAAAVSRGNATTVQVTDIFEPAHTQSRRLAIDRPEQIRVSGDMRYLAVLNAGSVRLFDLRVVKNYEHMPLSQMRVEACHALRNQPEQLNRVSSICSKAAGPAAGG